MPRVNANSIKYNGSKKNENELELTLPHTGGQRAIVAHPARFHIVASGRRYGKGLSIETPLLTANRGWITMGDVLEGDYVFGEDGYPAKVSFVSEIHNIDCYEITFFNGEKIICDEHHKWFTFAKKERRSDRYNKKYEGSVKSIKEMFARVYCGSEKKRENNHWIPITKPLKYPEQKLEIHPYLLGAWLGDGSSHCSYIYGEDIEIFQKIETFGYSYKKLKAPFAYSVFDATGNKEKNVTSLLRKINVLNNKHIPEIYQTASYQQRLELLKGLMDTDGHCNKDGICEYTGVNKQLVEDVHRLVTGLGIKAGFYEGNATLNGRFISKKYRIHFSTDLPVFHLKRKLERSMKSPSGNQAKVMSITDIQKINSVPTVCIAVDNESHLFLVGKSLIPTHNTSVGKYLSAKTMLSKPESHVAWVSPIAKMSNTVWENFLQTFSPIAAWISVQEKTIKLKNDSKITFWTAENPDALRGQAFNLAILDEAAMYKNSDIWYAVLRPALSDFKGSAYFMSTPRGRNWFYNLYEMGDKHNSKYDPNYQSWNFTSRDNPYFDPSELEEARKNLPEKYFRQEYLAEFLLDAGEVFQGVMDISNLPYADFYHGNFVAGVDIARKDDFTVITVMDTDTNNMVDMVRINNMDFASQRKAIHDIYRKWDVGTFFIEANNAGRPVVEQLEEEGIPVEEFWTTNKSKQEIIDLLAVDIQNQNIGLLNDIDLVNELQAYSMSRTKTGKISYAATSGFHDDIVMSLAICNYGAKKYDGVFGSGVPMIA